MFVPANPIGKVNGTQYYGEFATLSDEGSTEALHAAWREKITPAEGRECDRCRGRGYTRKDHAVGCGVCFGTGRVV